MMHLSKTVEFLHLSVLATSPIVLSLGLVIKDIVVHLGVVGKLILSVLVALLYSVGSGQVKWKLGIVIRTSSTSN